MEKAEVCGCFGIVRLGPATAYLRACVQRKVSLQFEMYVNTWRYGRP